MVRKNNLMTFFTSLDMETGKKIDVLAKTRGLTRSEFVRAVLLEHIERLETEESTAKQREAALAEELKKSTNRICALLAKAAIDINSVARYIWETADDDGQDLYETCHEKAVRRVKQRVSPDEQEIVERLIN